jgi:hypothetical protein
MTERCQLFYLSRLATGASPVCVAEIVRASRKRNTAHGINSLLVFDGWRFCQYIEGANAAVGELADRIRTDARHTDVKMLYQGPTSTPLVLGGHSLVYALNYDDSLDRFEQTHGAQAIALLAGLLPTFDMEPEFACM